MIAAILVFLKIAIPVIVGIAFLKIVIPRTFKVVRPWQVGLVERFGRFIYKAESGLVLLIPFVDCMRIVDMRERPVDVPPQGVITKDNVVVQADAIVYYRIDDPLKAAYNISALRTAITKLAQTALRSEIGELSLDESLDSRGRISTALERALVATGQEWGTTVTKVELQRIEPPSDVTSSMHQQMKAERTKRAAILEAEGLRLAAIEEAEGNKQANILKAEGEAAAVRKKADAEEYSQEHIALGQSRAIQTVFGAIHEGKPTEDLLTLKYIEALMKIGESPSAKIMLPSNLLGGIAGIGEMLK